MGTNTFKNFDSAWSWNKNKNKKPRFKGIKKNICLIDSNLRLEVRPHSERHCLIEVFIGGIVILSGFLDIIYYENPHVLTQKIKEALPDLFESSSRGGAIK